MSQQRYYTTQLQAGLGLLEETRQLLQVYQPGMSASQLYEAALASGRFPLVTARRLRNIVAECFAPRYMRDPYVAARLKSLVDRFTTAELNQLLFIYTARANLVLADFVREVYWARYSAGQMTFNWRTRAPLLPTACAKEKRKSHGLRPRSSASHRI